MVESCEYSGFSNGSSRRNSRLFLEHVRFGFCGRVMFHDDVEAPLKELLQPDRVSVSIT